MSAEHPPKRRKRFQKAQNAVDSDVMIVDSAVANEQAKGSLSMLVHPSARYTFSHDELKILESLQAKLAKADVLTVTQEEICVKTRFVQETFTFPAEIWRQVFKYLGYLTLRKMRRVSKVFSHILGDKAFDAVSFRITEANKDELLSQEHTYMVTHTLHDMLYRLRFSPRTHPFLKKFGRNIDQYLNTTPNFTNIDELVDMVPALCTAVLEESAFWPPTKLGRVISRAPYWVSGTGTFGNLTVKDVMEVIMHAWYTCRKGGYVMSRGYWRNSYRLELTLKDAAT